MDATALNFPIRTTGHAPKHSYVMIAWALLCVVSALWVYQHSYHAPFIFDDRPAILENQHLRQLWPIWEAMSAPPASPLAGRPVVSLTFAINYQISGLEPWSYHALNLAIHIVNALLLMATLARVFDLPSLRAFILAGRAKAISLTDTASKNAVGAGVIAGAWPVHLAGGIALLWTVHPLNSEAVVYVTQRTELMVIFFYLLTLYAALRAFTTPRPLVWYSLSIAACALGMASKEVMVSAPLMVLLLDRTLAAGTFKQALKRRQGFYLGLALCWGVLLMILFTNPRGTSVGYQLDYTSENYLMMQMRIITFYLQACFWPDGLAIFHDYAIPGSWREVLGYTVLIGALGLLTLVLLWWGKTGDHRRAWALPGCLFFMVLAPSSSIVPIVTEPAAERRMYLPLAAVLVVVVLLLWWMLSRLPGKLAKGGGLLLLLLLTPTLAFSTMNRVEDYRSELSIWQAAVREYPQSALLHNLLALTYERAGNDALCMELLDKALKLDPQHADAHFNRGRLLLSQGDLAGAKDALTRALELMPIHHEARLWLGRVALKEGDIATAQAYTERALSQVGPLGDVLVMQGLLALAQNDQPTALTLFDRAIQLPGNNQEAYYQLGQTLESMNRPVDAWRVYELMLQQHPGDAVGSYALGLLLLRGGDLDKALPLLTQAVNARPQPVAPRIRLAWTLAVHPRTEQGQWQQAFDMAQQAVQETQQRDPAALEAQAAALARLGRFTEAAALQQTALQVTQELGQAQSLPAMQRRLELYQQGQPYVQQVRTLTLPATQP